MSSKTHVCTRCKKEMPLVPAGSQLDRLISGEVCDECLQDVGAQGGMPLRDFLDGLVVPVLLIDGEGAVQAANKATRELLKKDISQIEGYRGGDVFECANARLPEGCGRTQHCSGCAIRLTVMDTFLTGKSHRGVQAYLNRDFATQLLQLGLVISTEKIWDMVMLRIEYIGPAGQPMTPLLAP